MSSVLAGRIGWVQFPSGTNIIEIQLNDPDMSVSEVGQVKLAIDLHLPLLQYLHLDVDGSGHAVLRYQVCSMKMIGDFVDPTYRDEVLLALEPDHIRTAAIQAIVKRQDGVPVEIMVVLTVKDGRDFTRAYDDPSQYGDDVDVLDITWSAREVRLTLENPVTSMHDITPITLRVMKLLRTKRASDIEVIDPDRRPS